MQIDDHDFCDTCPLCRPAMIELQQPGAQRPDVKKLKKQKRVIDRVWDFDTSYDQRRAFILVTRNRSTDSADVELCRQVNEKIQAALALLERE